MPNVVRGWKALWRVLLWGPLPEGVSKGIVRPTTKTAPKNAPPKTRLTPKEGKGANVDNHLRKADYQLRRAVSGLTRRESGLVKELAPAIAIVRRVRTAFEAERHVQQQAEAFRQRPALPPEDSSHDAEIFR